MPNYVPEPPFNHLNTAKTGLLLINLGTPAAPTAAAVRPYLKEFLSDTRVVEIPRLIWSLILNGIILNIRPKKSAEKYASIWTAEGSPLAVYTRQQTDALRETLQQRGHHGLSVRYAMRYGQPAVADVMQEMRAEGVERFVVLPLYPQYAGSSSASALDAVLRVLLNSRNMPEVRTVRHFHDHAGYIHALASRVRHYWAEHGKGDKLLMSFHGVPRSTLDQGDPYHCECHKTGRLLAEALELKPEEYQVTFQSRFGKAEWIKPYTSECLTQLGQAKTRRLDVICPGFVSDCLETLEEIAIEGKETFQHAGGGDYHYIPCLNTQPEWISALADLAESQLSGWPTQAVSALDTTRQARAKSFGASQ